ERIVHEDMSEARHDLSGRGADTRGIHGHLAPAQDAQTFFGDDALDALPGLLRQMRFARQKRQTYGIRASGGQLEVDACAQERVVNLNEDARAVARVCLRALRTA